MFYEISYNLILRNNVIRNNAMVSGKRRGQEGHFPEAAVYLSRVRRRPAAEGAHRPIEIYGNAFDNNWSGITAWENSDRFCNSPANTSTGVCTPFVPEDRRVRQPGIAKPPLYNDCRWKTQRVDIRDNTFPATCPADLHAAYASRMAILANYGTYPDWSPYKGDGDPARRSTVARTCAGTTTTTSGHGSSSPTTRARCSTSGSGKARRTSRTRAAPSTDGPVVEMGGDLRSGALPGGPDVADTQPGAARPTPGPHTGSPRPYDPCRLPPLNTLGSAGAVAHHPACPAPSSR